MLVTLPVCFDAAYVEDEEASRPTKMNKKQNRPAPKFKPTSQKPLPMPLWTRPAQPLAPPGTAFRMPNANLMSRFLASKAGAKRTSTDQQKSAATKTASNHQSASHKDTSANVLPHSSTPKGHKKKSKFAVQSFFPFKFIVRYNNANQTSFDFHDFKDLQNDMSDFWHRLSELVLTRESRAGAFWRWELEKPSRKKGVRVCVSSALAKKRKRWRRDDAGFFACQDCASRALPCITWVRHGGEQDGNEEAEGEFWCLPVHEEDRYIPETVNGREVRIWINETSEDENGSENGYGGFGDDMAFVGSESEQDDDDDDDDDHDDDDDDGEADKEESEEDAE